MNINRYNYEEFFILYLDNELDSDGRREVEAFAEQNPDLKAELDILMQSKLTPDTQVSFADKDSLMRFGNSSISLANYEEWLTAYVDNELSDVEKEDAEKFIAGNPSIQRELNLLQHAKLQPEAIVFPYKDSLYRKEERARVIPVRWWRAAAAAMLLLGISTTAIVLMNNKTDEGNKVVAITPSKEIKPNIKTDSKKDEIATTVDAPIKKQGKIVSREALRKDQNYVVVSSKNNDASVKSDESKEQNLGDKNVASSNDVATNNKVEDKISNNLPTPMNPNIQGNTTGANDASNKPDNKQLATAGKKTDDDPVTPGAPNTYSNQKATDNSGIEFANAKSGGGLRGFLRKVTRTFEKRTNIKATDDDDRLLIAGVAIKLN